MARLSLSRKRKILITINALFAYLRMLFVLCVAAYGSINLTVIKHCQPSRSLTIRLYKQVEYMYSLVYWSDAICIDQLRMDRQSFHKLCQILASKGQLRATKNVSIKEMVSMFLNILVHHKKNRSISLYFTRSGRTVSKYFHECLKAMIRCQKDFWKMPVPVPEDSTDIRWKWFKNCLGALDGTHIMVKVPKRDKPRYKTRKCEIATNVLGVCSQDLMFIYVLPGWEGSAHDALVLRDAAMAPKFEGLIDVLSTDKEIADMQSKLRGEIRKMDFLTPVQVFHITNKLAKDHDMLGMFFSNTAEEKKDHIIYLLEYGFK